MDLSENGTDVGWLILVLAGVIIVIVASAIYVHKTSRCRDKYGNPTAVPWEKTRCD